MLTNDDVWFNHLIVFHSSSLPPIVRKQSHHKPPKECFFNDNEIIKDEIISKLITISNNNQKLFTWEKGDILLLDNYLTSHGRKTVTSEREILVTLSY
jgi:hypothetical protein